MMRIEPDPGLIEACIKRDEAAWARFVKKYSPLIAIAVVRCSERYGFKISRGDVDDISQDTLLSIWKHDKLSGLKSRSSVAAWLAIVAGNETVGYMRRKGLELDSRPVSLYEKAGEGDLADILPSLGDGPDDESLKNDLAVRLRRAIGALPHNEMLVMKLNLLHDKKYHEIAEMLGMPKGTVSSYIKRAKERLRASLKED